MGRKTKRVKGPAMNITIKSIVGVSIDEAASDKNGS
jgi:hypothetical protein